METITTKIIETKQAIGEAINTSRLPSAVLAMILNDYLQILNRQTELEYQRDLGTPEQEEADIDGSTTP